MFQAKDNYGDKGLCRLCKDKEETIEHLGVCTKRKSYTKQYIRSEQIRGKCGGYKKSTPKAGGSR